jgi:hypothetical protein
MRSVCLAMKMSLDGYVVGPNGELDWLFPSVDPEQDRDTTAWLEGVDTIPLGRVACEEQSRFWPTQPSAMAKLLNARGHGCLHMFCDSAPWVAPFAGSETPCGTAGVRVGAPRSYG